MEWTYLYQLLESPWNLTEYHVYDILQAGLPIINDWDNPVLPKRLVEKIREREIWEEWLKANTGESKPISIYDWAAPKDRQLKELMNDYGYKFDQHGWPQAPHVGRINLPWNKEPKPPTIEDAIKRINSLTDEISERMKNPWINCEFSNPWEDQFEKVRIMKARAKTADIRKRLSEDHPLFIKGLPVAKIGPERSEASADQENTTGLSLESETLVKGESKPTGHPHNRKKKTPVNTPVTNAIKARQSKYYDERKVFERFVKQDLPGIKVASIADMIRKAKRRHPKTLGAVPEKQIRKWYEKMTPA